MEHKLIVSASPHVRAPETTASMMGNVIIAMLPCLIASALIFGTRSLLLVAVSVIACVLFEYLYCKLMKKPNPVGDLSAVVTGMILAFNVPSTLPVVEIIIGAFIAIVVIKQLFGGIGMNFANPALVARIILFLSFTADMNTLEYPDAAVDQLAKATPLAVSDPSALNLFDLFLGVHAGTLGEVCIAAIILGFLYLVATRTISAWLPISYVATVFVCYMLVGTDPRSSLIAILSGGLFFGAVFMATDYVTSPFTLRGKLVYGIGLGLITFAIRYWGSYPEGVSFALLFMSLLVPFINDLTRQKAYGDIKVKEEAAK